MLEQKCLDGLMTGLEDAAAELLRTAQVLKESVEQHGLTEGGAEQVKLASRSYDEALITVNQATGALVYALGDAA